MGSASVLQPKFTYYPETVTVTAINDQFVFRETVGVDLTASLVRGTYSRAQYSVAVRNALQSFGGGTTYIVSYDYATQKHTIESDGLGGGGIFQPRVGGANSGWADLGFTANPTGALTYTSDTAVPALTTVICTQRIQEPELEDVENREDVETETGRREGTSYGGFSRYKFYIEFETPAIVQALRLMWKSCGRFGNAFDFYPDHTNQAKFITCLFDPKSMRWAPMWDRKLYRLFRIDYALRFKEPAPYGSSTIDPADFLDQRPSAGTAP